MNVNSLLVDNRWSNALYLTERYEQFNLSSNQEGLNQNDDDIIKDWLNNLSDDRDLLKRRLNAENMEFYKFKSLLLEKQYQYNVSDYEWYQELVSVFKNNGGQEIGEYTHFNAEEIPFFEFYIPFLKRTVQIMEEWLEDTGAWIGKRRVIGVVLQLVADKIFQLSVKTLIYELNKSRVNEELEGNDPKQRYQSFVNTKIKDPADILKLLLDYPVLARMIAENVKQINKNILVVLDRLINDKSKIEKFFNVNLENLQEIDFLGDSHNDGASVLRLKFKDTSIMYKPRDLEIDIAFANLLKWFNKKDINNQFKIAKTLNKGEYGWQEFIPYKECNQIGGVEKYFERQGQYMAILYAINATDMHMENIIAHGEHPFFVDLESLFHNRPFTYLEEKDGYTAREKASLILDDSVLKTSMLPTLDPNSLYHSDLSGLAGDTVQVMNTYEIFQKNTDEMKIKRNKIKVDKYYHLPSYKEQPITPENYQDKIKNGFFQSYQLIMQHRDEFINLFYKLFEGCVVRTIIRPTISYFSLLEASSHPKYLKDGLDKIKLIDIMWSIIQHDSSREESVKYECYDLIRGDVPLFRTVIGQKNLMHHRDSPPIKKAYYQDIITITKRKILQMNEEDLETQWEFIERTVQTKYLLEKTHTMEKITDSVNLDMLEKESIRPNNNDRALREAIRIGDYIKSIVVQGDDGQTVSWIGMGMDADEKLVYKPTDVGLYNGVTGIAYFFMYLGKETGNKEYVEIANQCINTAWEMVRNNIDRNISVFTGYGSLLYVLLHRSKLFEQHLINDEVIELMDILEEMIEADDKLDIISGCAGTLITCLDIYDLYKSPKALEIAQKCGEHLLKKSQPRDTGIAWVTSTINKAPLSGIAHGNAGICLSLARLYDTTDDYRYLDACLAGIEYENSLYSPTENNWKDLRFSDGQVPDDHFVMYWCNGAPGLGIARIGKARYIESKMLDSDIDKTLEKTMRDGFTEVSYSLCHGDMGNLELILLGADHLNSDQLNTFVSQMTNRILNEVEKIGNHWKCGIPGRQQIPGLMLGLSGIGYQLLRIFNRHLPSVLLLEGPNDIASFQKQGIKADRYYV
ncbi:type 2 lantibiotic biosynthesis protein LanM [Salibacterium salarium]|uniref:type 2 lanthipeptide synthetase LanM family protein n=1 Tax=Salibacterium salarium TaxID=284579 RepID=UPI002783893F|nr:type 2 lanthipeptide synthetase LanM family protein [Salibacterium salarium]MDQ0300384.1 type 2 lantibiotic biosynthesis protein LanM [Salibacterium salarium]